MYRTGRVVELTVHHMRLSLEPAPACSACHSAFGGGCGGLFAAWWQQSRQRRALRDRYPIEHAAFEVAGDELLDLDRIKGVSVGDRVRVDISPALALQLAFIAYCVPVMLLLTGAVFGHVLFPMFGSDLAFAAVLSPVIGPVTGLIGFVGGLFAYRPLVKYLLDGRTHGRDAQGNSLLKTSLLLGPG